MCGHAEAIHVNVLSIQLGRPGKDGGTCGSASFKTDDGAVSGVHPDGAFDEIGRLLARRDCQREARPSIDRLHAAGLERHLIVGGDEPRVLANARLIDLLFAVEDCAQDVLENHAGAGLREDGVGLAGLFAVIGAYRHFGGGIGFVLTPVDGVVFGNGIGRDAVDPGFDGGIDLCDDRRKVRLLSW